MALPLHSNPPELVRSILKATPGGPGQKIMVALNVCGTCLAQLAREWDVSRFHLSEVAHGKRQSPRLQARLATYLDVDLDDLWPEQQSEAA